jgi:hypothetical protein
MDTPGLLLLVAAAVLAVVGAALAVTLVSARAERRRLAEELSTSRAAVAELRGLVEQLSGRVDGSARDHAEAPDHGGRRGFVITSLRQEPAEHPAVPETASAELAVVPLSGRDFASVALTESAVRVVSLAHGVRRALSAENRNRIRFEVRREVRRSRRQRRRDLKEARRHLRAHGAPAGRDAA